MTFDKSFARKVEAVKNAYQNFAEQI